MLWHNLFTLYIHPNRKTHSMIQWRKNEKTWNKISERNRAFVCFKPIMRTHYIIPYEFFHLSDIMRENIIVMEKEGRKEKTKKEVCNYGKE